MANRHVIPFVGGDGQAQADQFDAHGIGAGRLGVEGKGTGACQLFDQGSQGFFRVHHVVLPWRGHLDLFRRLVKER